jgi:hypothetical protein
MEQMQILLVLLATAALTFALWRKIQKTNSQQQDSEKLLFSEVLSLFENPTIKDGPAAGSKRLDGAYQSNNFQLQTITDTLAVRKLPSLWLLVTLPCNLPVTAKLDLMMRPAGQTSFSNFDFLDHMISTPPEFPQFAQLRSDSSSGYAKLDIIKHHLGLFAISKFKELLISPQGLRIVIQAAEADRAYYGVLRNARFENTCIESELLKQSMDTLLALKSALEDYSKS